MYNTMANSLLSGIYELTWFCCTHALDYGLLLQDQIYVNV